MYHAMDRYHRGGEVIASPPQVNDLELFPPETGNNLATQSSFDNLIYRWMIQVDVHNSLM